MQSLMLADFELAGPTLKLVLEVYRADRLLIGQAARCLHPCPLKCAFSVMAADSKVNINFVFFLSDKCLLLKQTKMRWKKCNLYQ